MILITSAAYLGPEFQALLGKLPPSFLPVGNRRLYDLQLEVLAGLPGPVVLSLPDGFAVAETDRERLARSGAIVLKVPEGLSLGQSIVYAITVCDAGHGPIRILHGDTLCGPLDGVGDDVLLAAPTADHYSWAEVDPDADGIVRLRETDPDQRSARTVLTGYFAVSDAAVLARCISKARFDFIDGLSRYAAERPVSIAEPGEWLDFGHVQTYFRSKARYTTERAFNSLMVSGEWLEKSSPDGHKIAAEAAWYENLPAEIRCKTPNYLGRGTPSSGGMRYCLEYLYLNTLCELAVFGRLPSYVWQNVFRRCEAFLGEAAALAPTARASGARPLSRADLARKTGARLEQFAVQSGYDLDRPVRLNGRALPPVARIRDEIADMVDDGTDADLGLAHGDFCFSNIFHDFRSAQIRVVDPRGLDFDGRPTLWGDLRYDIAKFLQSVWGRYDFIVAGYCRFQRSGPATFDLELADDGHGWDRILAEFFRQGFAGYDVSAASLKAMTVQLFLSMLPLHRDNGQRQWALLANALRLYAELQEARP